MKPSLLTLFLAVGLVAGAGCQSNQSPDSPAGEQAATDDEPLLLLDDKPLLLTDAVSDDYTGPLADNSRCHVCHINYETEDIAVTHARAEIGCADCHGVSDAHIADESWSWGGNGTAPDIMYTLEKVNPACMKCHPKGQIDLEQHEPLFAGTGKEKYCTDCHGNHRLENRKCKWK